ncbi:MAG: ferrous iron transport protein B [bacterium]
MRNLKLNLIKNNKRINNDINIGCEKCEISNLNRKVVNYKGYKKLRIAIVGQPNSGKSTFFNSLTNFKVNTANYSGTTVNYHITSIIVKNYEIELIDLPGIYSFCYSDLAEKVTFEILTKEEIDGIIQVIESPSLAHSLVLTLDLLTLDIPMVIALNMIDEARSKGVFINSELLENLLNIPVIETIATKGYNSYKTVIKIINEIEQKNNRNYNKDLENKVFNNVIFNTTVNNIENYINKDSLQIQELKYIIKEYKNIWRNLIDDVFKSTNCHIKDCKLMPACLMNIEKMELENKDYLNYYLKIRNELLKIKSFIIKNINDLVIKYDKPKPTLDDILDKVVLHNFWGYILLSIILLITFGLVFVVGNKLGDISEFLANQFWSFLKVNAVINYLNNTSYSFITPLIQGIVDGINGGLGIVLPYLIPLVLFISILEDSGYIPRMVYLFDNILRKFGFSGRSILAFILGYGCNVTAIMSLRNLTTSTERILAGIVIPLIPCSARTVVIMALVTAYLGPIWGVSMYLFSLLVLSLVLLIIQKISNLKYPTLIMHIPSYRFPTFKSLIFKTYLKVKSFIYTALPVLILGTILLNYFAYFHLEGIINKSLSLLTVNILSLPEVVGLPLIFGVLAKEYALALLYSALKTENVLSVMTVSQVLVFTVFVMFYTPCISTIATQIREIGTKYTLYSIVLSLSIALFVSIIVKFALTLIF